MKVICEMDYKEYFTSSQGKVLVQFEKGKVYEAVTEYDNCFLFYENREGFLVKKIYFLTLNQVLKRKLLSINK